MCKIGPQKVKPIKLGGGSTTPPGGRKKGSKMTIFDPQVYGECLEKCKFGRTFGSWGLKYRPKNGQNRVIWRLTTTPKFQNRRGGLKNCQKDDIFFFDF